MIRAQAFIILAASAIDSFDIGCPRRDYWRSPIDPFRYRRAKARNCAKKGIALYVRCMVGRYTVDHSPIRVTQPPMRRTSWRRQIKD